MQTAISSAHLAIMETQRGKAIEDRLNRLGISDREFHEQTGIDRKTLRRAIGEEPRVRPSTYAAIESALDKLERSVTAPAPVVEDEGYVEFTVEGNFGVRAIVKGPVRDMEQLQAAVARILREMRESSDSGD